MMKEDLKVRISRRAYVAVRELMIRRGKGRQLGPIVEAAILAAVAADKEHGASIMRMADDYK